MSNVFFHSVHYMKVVAHRKHNENFAIAMPWWKRISGGSVVDWLNIQTATLLSVNGPQPGCHRTRSGTPPSGAELGQRSHKTLLSDTQSIIKIHGGHQLSIYLAKFPQAKALGTAE